MRLRYVCSPGWAHCTGTLNSSNDVLISAVARNFARGPRPGYSGCEPRGAIRARIVVGPNGFSAACQTCMDACLPLPARFFPRSAYARAGPFIPLFPHAAEELPGSRHCPRPAAARPIHPRLAASIPFAHFISAAPRPRLPLRAISSQISRTFSSNYTLPTDILSLIIHIARCANLTKRIVRTSNFPIANPDLSFLGCAALRRDDNDNKTPS